MIEGSDSSPSSMKRELDSLSTALKKDYSTYCAHRRDIDSVLAQGAIPAGTREYEQVRGINQGITLAYQKLTDAAICVVKFGEITLKPSGSAYKLIWEAWDHENKASAALKLAIERYEQANLASSDNESGGSDD